MPWCASEPSRMKKEDIDMAKAKITAKCIRCKKKAVLSEKQMTDAQELGCAMSECCSFPMEVVKVQI